MDLTDIPAHDAGVAFSRSAGLPAWMGKATCPVKTMLPDCVKDDLLRRARASGMTESELLRHWVLVQLYGFEQVVMMERQRLELAATIGTERSGG